MIIIKIFNDYTDLKKEDVKMLEELKTFVAVVEYNSFTKAAENLNLSQPTVSVHIKNLESYFNTILIERSIKQKNMVITESGDFLYKRAKEILMLMESSIEEINNTSHSLKGHLKIGASYTIGEYYLPKLLKEYSKEYPDVKIEVVIKNTSDICKGVEDFKLDIGLIEGLSTRFDFVKEYFSKDRMVLMVPYEHPLASEGFSIEKLQNQRWICREEGSGTREYLNMFLTANEIIPKNIMVMGSNYSIKEAVRNDLGITLISNYVAEEAEKNKEVSIIELDQSYRRHFSYILNSSISISKATKAFIEKIKNN
ncbi:HTH-type transcriptional regulator CysL [Clostridium liquoris]|jgi:DNA-binding transcriptional LysR family regulator|uniref:HTH-type transcriptional regulator CysL n=2 Tax=Clostridium liquoris TaxID=1289519 RepID=A0A2T0B8J7_9CLOT|nr:HTH-type transcriptional regulator CysL [Clostridium liquoris]